MVPGARRARTRAAERLRVLCLTLIAHSGCRPFEAVQLEWAEVRWEERILAVGAGRDKGRRKGRAPRKPRRIALPPRLMQALASLRGWDQSHPVYAFLPSWSRSAGAPSVKEMIRWFREELKPAARAAGIAVPEEATMYWLRHDWQTTGLEVDSAEGVAAAAGNSPQVLLSTYDHTRNRRIRDVADKVGNARRKSARKPAG
jgi:integrase